MAVPAVNLKPALAATARAWKRNLQAMFERAHFILGEELAAFEREFAQALDARFAVGCASGTGAIELCLRHAGASSAGGEVLTSALTAPFTAIAILAAGAQPQFADVDPDTLQMDPADAADRIDKRTTAIVPVHLYGQPCRIDLFQSLARASGKILIQDACQAHGARFRGRAFTGFSGFVAFSFYPTKNLGCLGDGGAVLTNKASVATRLGALRDGGRVGSQVSRFAGVNSRLDEMQCCYLR
ncbi:MAG: DegT/DnrJ/EryC1/StrS family aminotransferase, partial [Bryobacteraceae bacterium]